VAKGAHDSFNKYTSHPGDWRNVAVDTHGVSDRDDVAHRQRIVSRHEVITLQLDVVSTKRSYTVKHGLAPRRERKHDIAYADRTSSERHNANLAVGGDGWHHAPAANPNPRTRAGGGSLTHHLEQLGAIDFD
jgi:hypothetical protein